MGSGSIFDDIGLGASDLGFSADPKKVEEANRKKIDEERTRLANEEEVARTQAFEKENVARQRTRSSTVLTGAQGVEDEEGNIARRTLLGA